MPRNTAKTAGTRRTVAPTPEPATPSLPDGFEVQPSGSTTVLDAPMIAACATAIRAMGDADEVRTPIVVDKDHRKNTSHDYLVAVRKALGEDRTRGDLVLGTRTIKTDGGYRLVFRFRTPTANHED